MRKVALVFAVLVLGLAINSFAQDASDFSDSTLKFTAPTELKASTEFEFVFEVTNNAQITGEKQNWIRQVDVSMPSTSYKVNPDDIQVPDPIHSGTFEGEYQIDHWEKSFNDVNATITWTAFGVVTSFEYGDIREGETLRFAFKATTDADAKDGFKWVLYGDEGDKVEGTAYVETENPPSNEGGDDDDNGCGC